MRFLGHNFTILHDKYLLRDNQEKKFKFHEPCLVPLTDLLHLHWIDLHRHRSSCVVMYRHLSFGFQMNRFSLVYFSKRNLFSLQFWGSTLHSRFASFSLIFCALGGLVGRRRGGRSGRGDFGSFDGLRRGTDKFKCLPTEYFRLLIASRP